MALPASGAISFRDINVELGLSPTAQLSLNDAAVRTLFAKASGAIAMSDGYGKSNRAAISYTYSASTADATLNLSGLGGYAAGTSDITVTINSSVYLYATSTGNYGLNISGGTTGDTLTIVNNGYIMGRGGTGGSAGNATGSSGGPALNIPINATINNTNASAYIGGGGGGGAHSSDGCGDTFGGGGGAGGGNGGKGNIGRGGVGGGIGSSGTSSQAGWLTGGGGGRIFPGTTSAWTGDGAGGQAGGGGANNTNPNGRGGGSNSAGINGTGNGCGGGGGWGAKGGNSGDGDVGASGGKAVNLNGKTVTWTSGDTTRVYGSVS